jgi:hypothetical protein
MGDERMDSAADPGRGGVMDWKSRTTLGEMALRAPLWIRIDGRWAPTTPYELLEGFRFPRFLTVGQVEFTMGTEIRGNDEARASAAA